MSKQKKNKKSSILDQVLNGIIYGVMLSCFVVGGLFFIQYYKNSKPAEVSKPAPSPKAPERMVVAPQLVAEEKSAKPIEAEIVLTTKNTVAFRGEFDDYSVVDAQVELQRLIDKRGAQSYAIYLVLDSPGGSVTAGMDLINFINAQNNVHTITLDGASMAAITAQLVNGNRYVTDSSTMMFHRAAVGGIGGQINDGEVETRIAYLKSMLRSITQRVAKRLKISYEELQSKQKDEYWLYGSDIVTQGAADQVVSLRCTSQLISEKILIVTGGFFTSGVVTFSACPLLRAPIGE